MFDTVGLTSFNYDVDIPESSRNSGDILSKSRRALDGARHGAEVQGNAVIFQLLKQLEQSHLNSVVTLVPLANPMGINQKSGEFTLGRFDPITGVNWNREYLEHKFDIEVWYLKHQHETDDVLVAKFRDKLLTNCVIVVWVTFICSTENS